MAVIEIIGREKGGAPVVLDEAKNRKEAKCQVDYWQSIKQGWKISTKVIK